MNSIVVRIVLWFLSRWKNLPVDGRLICSICSRQLQGILLLRDGRFLLIRTSEMQSTIDTQANAHVYRCFVADSLWSIVMFAQDPKSREVLRTQVPDRCAMNHLSVKKHPVDERVAQVKLPRIEPSFDGELIQNPDFEHIFGSFRSADGVPGEGSLFSSVELVQEEARRRLKPGTGNQRPCYFNFCILVVQQFSKQRPWHCHVVMIYKIQVIYPESYTHWF